MSFGTMVCPLLKCTSTYDGLESSLVFVGRLRAKTVIPRV